jgi:hypothetical protein
MVAGRVFVDDLSPSMSAILVDAHEMGHEGVAKSLHHLWANFYIPHVCQAT